MVNILDFQMASASEACVQLGGRLKALRLSAGLTQAELAARAGVSRGTVVSLENKGQSTLNSLVRVVQALGLVDQLGALFLPEIRSIADMELQAQVQAPTRRVRASNKPARKVR